MATVSLSRRLFGLFGSMLVGAWFVFPSASEANDNGDTVICNRSSETQTIAVFRGDASFISGESDNPQTNGWYVLKPSQCRKFYALSVVDQGTNYDGGIYITGRTFSYGTVQCVRRGKRFKIDKNKYNWFYRDKYNDTGQYATCSGLGDGYEYVNFMPVSTTYHKFDSAGNFDWRACYYSITSNGFRETLGNLAVA